MHTAYSSNELANVFANNDNNEDLDQSEVPMYNTAFEADLGAKRHAACDKCRKRKLKCSGDPAACARCVKQSLICNYSKQAVMGRPRKKRKTPEQDEPLGVPRTERSVESRNQPSMTDSTKAYARAEFQSLCPGPWTQYIKSRTPAPPPPFLTQGSLYEHAVPTLVQNSDGTPPIASPRTPILSQQEINEAAYSKGNINWADFSTMTTLPHLVQDNHPDSSNSSEHANFGEVTDSTPGLPSTSACACLPNMYLTLSSLSTLASFPISIHTIESLQTAHRTAQSVLYCRICPIEFQSGMQNVMLSGTLLTVLADSWHRVRSATASELRSGFSPPKSTSMVEDPPLTDLQSLQWRTFAYQLLRVNVFGDKLTPCPPYDAEFADLHPDPNLHDGDRPKPCRHLASINSSTSTPTLQALVDAMERRQSYWHGQGPDTGEFPKHMSKTALREHMPGMTIIQSKELEMAENGHLCLNLVQRARLVLQTLDQAEPTIQ